MDTAVENLDNLSPEELLGPPKYDGIGILMVMLASFMVGMVAWVIVMLLAYFAIGPFSLESGASPILLVFISFIALTIGNILYYTFLARIFPHIYSRGRTALGQIVIMSIILYVLFVPIYLVISDISTETYMILIAFSAHVIVNNFFLWLVISLISQYRYALLGFYSSIISLVMTTSVIVIIESQVVSSSSSKALFILMGLTILTYTLSATLSASIAWIYYRMYKVSWYDPIGSVFARIEEDDRALERDATTILTHFHK